MAQLPSKGLGDEAQNSVPFSLELTDCMVRESGCNWTGEAFVADSEKWFQN